MKSPRFLAVLCAAVVVAGCGTAAPDGAATVEPGAIDTETGVGSYARGLITGRRGASEGIDVEAFIAGVRDGMTGAEQQFTDDEMQAGLAALDEAINEEMMAAAAANKARGAEFMATNGARDAVTETASGLQYEVVREGDGERPMASNTVRVHYRGTTLDGEVFDESYAQGEPVEFPLARVIAGWTEGLQLMSVGSHYRFWIPSDLAYGDEGRPGAVFGPGDMLIFDVELLEITG